MQGISKRFSGYRIFQALSATNVRLKTGSKYVTTHYKGFEIKKHAEYSTQFSICRNEKGIALRRSMQEAKQYIDDLLLTYRRVPVRIRRKR